MNTELYKITSENFYTLISYYELIKKKSETYHSYISKFNKITSDYHSNIKNIFINEEGFFGKDKDIFDGNIPKKKLTDKISVDIPISNEKNIKKIIHISPIEANIEKIKKLFKNYLDGIELFMKSTEKLLLSINKNLENTKTKINEIINNYSSEKMNFIQNYSEFEELNKKLNTKYFDQEKNLVQYILKNFNNEKEKKSEENKINVKIYNGMKSDKEFDNNLKNLGNFGKAFNDFHELIIEKVKKIIEDFYKEFEIQINDIIILYQKSFTSSITQLLNEKEITKLKESEFNDIINNSINKLENKFYDFSFDEYNIKILNKNLNDENDEFSKILAFLIKNSNKKISDNDIYYIVKKMYNFKYINKKEYILDIEKEKLNLNERIDRLFVYAKNKKISDWNLIYKINENKEKTNNINKNEKEIDVIAEDIIIKNQPKEEDVDYICKLMHKKEFSDHFLIKLNNLRTLGYLEMPELIHNMIVRIIVEILKYIKEEKQTDNGKEIIIDYNKISNIFILSLTYYYIKDGEKIYLQNGLKNIELFHSAELWINLMQKNMEDEINKIAKKKNKIFNEKEFIENGNQICLLQILPYINSLYGFGLEKDKIIEVGNFFIDKYQLDEDSKKLVFQSIEDSVK